MSTPEQERRRAEIRQVKQRVEKELLARPEVTGVDINYKTTKGEKTDQLSIVVSVDEKKPKKKLNEDELIPAEIDGIQTDVIEEKIVPHRPAYAQIEIQLDKSTYPTLQGGIGIGPCRSVHMIPPDVEKEGDYVFVGTLGALVRDRATGAMMGLTNFHVACVDSKWKVGDRMTQPSRVDGGSCPKGEFGSLQRATLSEHVDGALIAIDPGKAHTTTIVDIGDVKGQGTAALGMAVRKRGRTTNLTYGKVTSLDYSTAIDYGDGLGERILRKQVRIEVDPSLSKEFGNHGDSGSVVVDENNSIIGLHFAGSEDGTTGIANPIQYVLDELGVEIAVPLPQPLPLMTQPYPWTCDPMPILKTKPFCPPYITEPKVCEESFSTSVIKCPPETSVPPCPPETSPAVCPPKPPPDTRWDPWCPPQPINTRNDPWCPLPIRTLQDPWCLGPPRTRDPSCLRPLPIRTRIEPQCLPPTKTCWEQEIPPWKIPDPRRWYGAPGGGGWNEQFWAGYAAAMEAVAEAEAQDAQE